MFNFELTGQKPPKAKKALLLSSDVVINEDNVNSCRKLIASFVGITEDKQFQSLLYLLDNLEHDVFLGSITELAKGSKTSRKPTKQMLDTLEGLGLVTIHNGYIRVSSKLPELFNSFDQEGNFQLTVNINMLANQTTLDL